MNSDEFNEQFESKNDSDIENKSNILSLRAIRNIYSQIEMAQSVFIESSQLTVDEKVIILQHLAGTFMDLQEYERLKILTDILKRIQPGTSLL